MGDARCVSARDATRRTTTRVVRRVVAMTAVSAVSTPFLRFANGSVVTWTRAGGCARARAVRERRVAFAARGGGAEDDGGRGEATTSGDGGGSAAPLRSTIPEGGLKIDRLLDTLSGDAEGKLSNRAKFRALPIDGAIMGRIKKYNLATTASTAGRTARVLRNREEISEVTARYAMYDVGMLDSRTRSLLGVGRSKRTAKFIAAAAKEGNEPPAHAVGKGASKIKDDVPEIAFAGRSNVGKSSLINALSLSSVARSSDVPGKTQSLNFYSLDERVRLVDMPGYGFAFAKQHRVETWNELMDKYLTSRPNLKRVYLVVDARHGLKASDREMLAFLSKYGQAQCAVILNKCDCVNPNDLARRAYLIQEELRYTKRARTMVLMASTSTGAGVTEIAREIFDMALDDPDGGGAEAAEDDRSWGDAYDDDDDGEYDEGGYERSGGGGKSRDKTEFYGGEWKPGQTKSRKFTPAAAKLGGGGRGGGRRRGRGRGKGFTKGTPGYD